MSIVRLQQTIAVETMFPQAFPRLEFARANSSLARATRAPFFVRAWGTSRFPTRLHTHWPKAGQ